jgi:hypothetical protein
VVLVQSDGPAAPATVRLSRSGTSGWMTPSRPRPCWPECTTPSWSWGWSGKADLDSRNAEGLTGSANRRVSGHSLGQQLAPQLAGQPLRCREPGLRKPPGGRGIPSVFNRPRRASPLIWTAVI